MAIDHEVLARLALQPWPGNVRELRNLIERTAMLGEVPARGRAEPLTFPRSTERASHVRPIADLEREEILRALAETAGTRRKRRAGWVSAGARSIAVSRNSASTRRAA
jgi:transcriptional regulator of acetoin/glycerol metabolism